MVKYSNAISGILPEKQFLDKIKDTRLELSAIVDGIDPINEFPLRFNSDKYRKKPIVDGIDPESDCDDRSIALTNPRKHITLLHWHNDLAGVYLGVQFHPIEALLRVEIALDKSHIAIFSP